MSVAAGTFLYAAIIEVILTELRQPFDHGVKLLVLTSSFGLMSALALWV